MRVNAPIELYGPHTPAYIWVTITVSNACQATQNMRRQLSVHGYQYHMPQYELKCLIKKINNNKTDLTIVLHLMEIENNNKLCDNRPDYIRLYRFHLFLQRNSLT